MQSTKRFGPRPLWLHLYHAQILWHYLPDFAHKMAQFHSGVKKYLDHKDGKKNAASFKVFWQKDDVSLLYKKQNNCSQDAIICLVPSLINGSNIFDLCKHCSFYDFLVTKGLSPYILDWGDGITPSKQSLEVHIENYLLPLLDHLENLEKPVFLFGYCLGGLMLLPVLQKKHYKNVHFISLATPWDFHTAQDFGQKWATIMWPQMQVYSDAHADVPIDLMQSFFAWLDPTKTPGKYLKFANMDMESEEAELFIAVEDWAADGRMLAWDVLRTCMQDFYLNNMPAEGRWEALGSIVSPDLIQNKTLIIVPERDKIVPNESALALAKKMNDAEVLRPDLGHVGLMGSRRAKKDLWIPIAKWIKKQLKTVDKKH